mmetsp:Transcript_23081/g.55951  ORF Transcript_23081/g.55951 Transcript_23081/m.55951 type:complete len:112 (-) Transcript_23081:4103-4438(-)
MLGQTQEQSTCNRRPKRRRANNTRKLNTNSTIEPSSSAVGIYIDDDEARNLETERKKNSGAKHCTVFLKIFIVGMSKTQFLNNKRSACIDRIRSDIFEHLRICLIIIRQFV